MKYVHSSLRKQRTEQNQGGIENKETQHPGRVGSPTLAFVPALVLAGLLSRSSKGAGTVMRIVHLAEVRSGGLRTVLESAFCRRSHEYIGAPNNQAGGGQPSFWIHYTILVNLG
jgi:hypothetical protein